MTAVPKVPPDKQVHEAKTVLLVTLVPEALTVPPGPKAKTVQKVSPVSTVDKVHQAQTENWVHEADQVHQLALSA